MAPTKPTNNTCLVVIDGWGIAPQPNTKGDAIYHANTPVMDGFEANQPFTSLYAHGNAVGLPEGLMGNSEVGHLNIGAGRIVYQDIVRIDLALKNNEFGKTPNIAKSFDHAKDTNGRLHLLGLVSDGGVHAHIKHLFGLLEAAKAAGVPETYVHFFADGRDTAPRSTVKYLQELLDFMNRDGFQYGKLATIVGRYYAMDRDKRWERIQLAFDGLTQGKGETTSDPVQTVKDRYAKDETDEFLKPIIANEAGLIQDNDTLFFFDFRADRMREIVQAFGVSPTPFDSAVPKNLDITTFTRYKADFPFNVAFPPNSMSNVLAEWLAKQGVPQCHVAETEKYAHVTFFFNGGTEAQFDQEHRDMIASPKVATYDKKPEMSAAEVGDKVAEEVASGKFPFVMCNFAPPDMVGHTGIYEAAIKGVEATDKAIGVIYDACVKHGYTLFVTSDHGNAEKMQSDDGGPHTAHTTAKVPFVMASPKRRFVDNADGALCDVAPTILKYMGLPQPEEMTGRSLLA
ncbi:2,3-bisphosphoglycerate-independent phosphoglycerate mutase [Dimargaris verticillata]|uniref:2,3-bisphosphoglycerate-independent phosphoglycerate mutase n=1 Tax=Dimargaris verticillata TaxID=2761393 RepID=A0A9W8BBK0_9FUNG|nr:2,3-bisphosphoglycerate-independent phosphoglycerate mutase [Dimargaris verticillata]